MASTLHEPCQIVISFYQNTGLRPKPNMSALIATSNHNAATPSSKNGEPDNLILLRDFVECWSIEGNGTPLQSSCLENPVDGGAWWAAVHGVAKIWTQLHFHFHFSLSCIGEGNGNPLQCSCLENPRDGGAWWAAVWGLPSMGSHGVRHE